MGDPRADALNKIIRERFGHTSTRDERNREHSLKIGYCDPSIESGTSTEFIRQISKDIRVRPSRELL